MGRIKAGQKKVADDHAQAARQLSELEITNPAGGLIILGPSAGPMKALKSLISSPDTGAIEANVSRLSSWKAASAEALDLTRRTSRVVRDGKTAIVHLDSHRTDDVVVPPGRHEFVCARLGQIMIGLADAPAYVVVHGQPMAQSLVYESLGDSDLPLLGAIADQFPVWELTKGTMFSGVPVAVCPSEHGATAVMQVLDWFEARRS